MKISERYYEENLVEGKVYYKTSKDGVWILHPASVHHKSYRMFINQPIDKLLFLVMEKLQISYKETYEKLGISSSYTTNLRTKFEYGAGSRFVLKVHDLTGFSVDEIRKVLNIPFKKG